MAKFKPCDKVIISKDSKNIWIRGKKVTIIRFLEEDNVPGSLYQWTYEVKLEDGDKSYVPQWEIELENSARHRRSAVFGDVYDMGCRDGREVSLNRQIAQTLKEGNLLQSV